MVGVGDGEAVGDTRTRLPVFRGGAHAPTSNKKAAEAASHLPPPKTARTKFDGKFMAGLTNFS
jgi:hypothetical protein